MHTFHFRKEQQLSTNWSGGTTTQLIIYPFDAVFSERTFMFRISTATVETETSSFTPFPGYKRLLMILEGTLRIVHTGEYSKVLDTFETDAFDGSWETTAKGKVRDFNVMYSKEVEDATLEKRELSKGETHLLSLEKYDFIGIYLLVGKIELNNMLLEENDFILCERSILENIFPVKAIENSIFILVHIDLK